jgi:dTDP-glucose 4,6-dehydratase
VFGSLGITGRFCETTSWQFPEKLIPVVILKAVAGEPIPLYGDGANVRDWLYVEDHVEALFLAAAQRSPPCPADHPGHDRRYAIDPTRISTELGWQPRHNFEEGLAATVDWYLDHLPWCQTVCARAGYQGERIGGTAI